MYTPMTREMVGTNWYNPNPSGGLTRRDPTAGHYETKSGTRVWVPDKTYAKGLAGDYQKAFDEAKAANESRYQEVLSGYKTRESGAAELMTGLGDQERSNLLRQYGELGASTRQGLRARGLEGTTIPMAAELGLAREQSQAVGSLEERLRREKLGYTTGLSGDTLGFMERREDEYPDYAQLERLAYAKGNTKGYGVGGSAGMAAGWFEPGTPGTFSYTGAGGGVIGPKSYSSARPRVATSSAPAASNSSWQGYAANSMLGGLGRSGGVAEEVVY